MQSAISNSSEFERVNILLNDTSTNVAVATKENVTDLVTSVNDVLVNGAKNVICSKIRSMPKTKKT